METKSYFKFEIMQTTKVLLYKIKKGDGKCWSLVENDDSQVIVLHEIGHPEKSVTIRMLADVLHITTVHGYVYVIEDNASQGARVTFCGPVNALLAQSLLPRMTYVPGTLRAMSSDMDDYATIEVFMERRKIRHKGIANPQDKYGWRVNMNFNNEFVPWFPPFTGKTQSYSPRRTKGKFLRQ